MRYCYDSDLTLTGWREGDKKGLVSGTARQSCPGNPPEAVILCILDPETVAFQLELSACAPNDPRSSLRYGPINAELRGTDSTHTSLVAHALAWKKSRLMVEIRETCHSSGPGIGDILFAPCGAGCGFAT